MSRRRAGGTIDRARRSGGDSVDVASFGVVSLPPFLLGAPTPGPGYVRQIGKARSQARRRRIRGIGIGQTGSVDSGLRMQVLFTSLSGLGHVYPMVPLARALRDRGHEVRWATGAEALPRVEAAGIPAAAAGLPSNESRLAEYRRRFPEALGLPPPSLADHMFPKLFGAISAPPMLGDLLTLVDPRPDLLIHDAAELAGPIVAASLGIPSVTHSFGGLVPSHRVAAAAREMARSGPHSVWRSHPTRAATSTCTSTSIRRACTPAPSTMCLGSRRCDRWHSTRARER